jgi:hypothetical protein
MKSLKFKVQGSRLGVCPSETLIYGRPKVYE